MQISASFPISDCLFSLIFSSLKSFSHAYNIEIAKNFLSKIVDSYLIAKLNDAVNFCFSRCKIVTIIFKVIIWSSRCAIGSYAIHFVIKSK